MSLVQLDLKFAGDDAAKQLREAVVDAVKDRLESVAAWLGERDYLEDRFTAGDLLMVTVLRILRHTDMVTRDAGAGCLRCALRGAPGVPEGARRADGGLRRQRSLARPDGRSGESALAQQRMVGAAQAAAGRDRPVERQGNDIDLALAQLVDHAGIVGVDDDAAFLEDQPVGRQPIGLVDRDRRSCPSRAATSAGRRSASAGNRPAGRA